MQIRERNGKRVEIDRAADQHDELHIKVPNTIWIGWMMDLFIKDEDLAAALRSLGWQVSVPQQVANAR